MSLYGQTERNTFLLDGLASGGDGVVEMTTNNARAAAYIEDRHRALNIAGCVRIVE